MSVWSILIILKRQANHIILATILTHLNLYRIYSFVIHMIKEMILSKDNSFTAVMNHLSFVIYLFTYLSVHPRWNIIYWGKNPTYDFAK